MIQQINASNFAGFYYVTPSEFFLHGYPYFIILAALPVRQADFQACLSGYCKP
jgi:hypothetical protein